jgi:hypothetical protein
MNNRGDSNGKKKSISVLALAGRVPPFFLQLKQK